MLIRIFMQDKVFNNSEEEDILENVIYQFLWNIQIYYLFIWKMLIVPNCVVKDEEHLYLGSKNVLKWFLAIFVVFFLGKVCTWNWIDLFIPVVERIDLWFVGKIALIFCYRFFFYTHEVFLNKVLKYQNINKCL